MGERGTLNGRDGGEDWHRWDKQGLWEIGLWGDGPQREAGSDGAILATDGS